MAHATSPASASTPARVAGRVRRLADIGGRTAIDVDVPGANPVTTVVDAVPNAAAARVAVAGLRHVGWVEVVLHGEDCTAQLFATTRTPVRRAVPLGAALALVAAGVPGVVSLEVSP